MIGWLWRVIVGRFKSCSHLWETVEQRNLTNAEGSTGNRYYLRCTTCGDYKKRDLI